MDKPDQSNSRKGTSQSNRRSSTEKLTDKHEQSQNEQSSDLSLRPVLKSESNHDQSNTKNRASHKVHQAAESEDKTKQSHTGRRSSQQSRSSRQSDRRRSSNQSSQQKRTSATEKNQSIKRETSTHSLRSTSRKESMRNVTQLKMMRSSITIRSHLLDSQSISDKSHKRNSRLDGSNASSESHLIRQSVIPFTIQMLNEVRQRNNFKSFDKEENGIIVDRTPKFLEPPHSWRFAAKFAKLHEEILERLHQKTRFEELMSQRRYSTGTISPPFGNVRLVLSMDEIIRGIQSSQTLLRYELAPQRTAADFADSTKQEKWSQSYIKVVLRKSDWYDLFEQNSSIIVKSVKWDTISSKRNLDAHNHSEEDFFTSKRNLLCQTSDGETQTLHIYCQSRATNTPNAGCKTISTFVSNCEMYDTYEKLKRKTKSSSSELQTILPIHHDSDKPLTGHEISELASFKTASMILQRLLASNEYMDGQRRYRNINMPGRFERTANYRYSVRKLFEYEKPWDEISRKATTDISFCAANGDIIAAGYGIYTFLAMNPPKEGYVGVWNIKNPTYPERLYTYNSPVSAVTFSPYTPMLLAIGLYSGWVEVRDITEKDIPPIAVCKLHSMAFGVPVIAIKWTQHISADAIERGDIEPFLALLQNGTVIKFRIINSPYFLEFKQMDLYRLEATTEGIVYYKSPLMAPRIELEASRHPQCLDLSLHPTNQDIFFVLTDEGCIHKCSLNFESQHLDALQTHSCSVTSMQFSPWSPKLFLTTGNDWCIRIWMEDIWIPLIELSHEYAPVTNAIWSRTNSKIIYSMRRRVLDIWDIGKSISKPKATHFLSHTQNTIARASNCGRILAVGTERGSVLMFGFEDMPLASHFQYDMLEDAIFKAIALQPDLVREVKNVGYFGYPNKERHIFE